MKHKLAAPGAIPSRFEVPVDALDQRRREGRVLENDILGPFQRFHGVLLCGWKTPLKKEIREKSHKPCQD
ncbi:hypothetical protein [Hydrogenophaga sp.]|uniref:hypothetical protein n=1 Tax=Hydrogenophaga sp. TaxID=1904254 RepID=UPI00260AF6F8|nr:hypothetical protein [Hydrogenophaga sp.]